MSLSPSATPSTRPLGYISGNAKDDVDNNNMFLPLVVFPLLTLQFAFSFSLAKPTFSSHGASAGQLQSATTDVENIIGMNTAATEECLQRAQKFHDEECKTGFDICGRTNEMIDIDEQQKTTAK